jgi:2-polyprenyl-6-hydroxyphenyl methylase/3-demethylubiquinone-9 3-methyltransferase
MNDARRQEFLKLQPLAHSQGPCPNCKICGAPTRLFDAVDFYKHCGEPPDSPYQFGLSGIIVPYYRCNTCRFIFTDIIDDWNSEDLREFIYNSDYLKVDPEYVEVRPRRTAMHLAPLLTSCAQARILDYGSGSGAFAKEMAAHGYTNIESYDPLSSPAPPSGTFDLITCFEVLEHASRPLDTLSEIAMRLSEGGAILIGQTLQPENIEDIAGRWWYLAPRNGHVSLFAHESFFALAERARLQYRGGRGVFGFTSTHVADCVETVIQRIRQGMTPDIRRRLGRARWRHRIRSLRRRLNIP